ncbi:unnamed protein product, partial [Phaeothamnion confervicola]
GKVWKGAHSSYGRRSCTQKKKLCRDKIKRPCSNETRPSPRNNAKASQLTLSRKLESTSLTQSTTESRSAAQSSPVAYSAQSSTAARRSNVFLPPRLRGGSHYFFRLSRDSDAPSDRVADRGAYFRSDVEPFPGGVQRPRSGRDLRADGGAFPNADLLGQQHQPLGSAQRGGYMGSLPEQPVISVMPCRLRLFL